MNSNKFTVSSLVLAIAAVAVLAGVATAQADPIRFDNPSGAGHFEWYNDVGLPEIRLDILLPVDQQPGLPAGDTTVYQQVRADYGSIFGSGVLDTWMHGSGTPDKYYAKPLPAGTLIPQGDPYWKNGTAYYYDTRYSGEEPYWLPDGETVYLGFRFDLGGGYQYGWAEVARGGSLLPQQLDVFAWGYETEVGVPIVAGVPEPGTLAMLAIGAVGVLRRRRA